MHREGLYRNWKTLYQNLQNYLDLTFLRIHISGLFSTSLTQAIKMISTLLLVRDCVTEGKIHSSVLCFKMIERKSLLEIELAMQLTRLLAFFDAYTIISLLLA